MSKLSNAANALLEPGEHAVQVFEGMSDGLNRTSRGAGKGAIYLAENAVIVAWVRTGLIDKGMAERFEPSEIAGVEESDEPLPGAQGALERKNASHAVARAMGQSATRPTLTVQTRRGDFALFFKSKQRGELRAASVAIGDLIAGR